MLNMQLREKMEPTRNKIPEILSLVEIDKISPLIIDYTKFEQFISIFFNFSTKFPIFLYHHFVFWLQKFEKTYF